MIGDQATGCSCHQVPTLCLHRACLMPDGPSPTPVETTLNTNFLLAVLGINGPINDKLRTLFGNAVKTGGLAIQDPTIATASLYSTSVVATEMLTGTLI
ncbi:hypothetical protein ACHAW6_002691 [Cyclotella cf. meneghiniana]